MIPSQRRLVFVVLVLGAGNLSSTPFASGQGLISSTNWRKPNITTPLPERVEIAATALEVSISNLDSSEDAFFPFPVLLHNQLSEFDFLANQTSHQVRVMEWLRQTNSTGRPFEVGRTAVNAYRAYKDASLLNVAEAMWNKAHSSVLTENNVDVVLSNFMCTDVIDVIGEVPEITREFRDSMLGGVFSDQNRTDTYTGEDNGLFLLLSASLAELTTNGTYLDAAFKSSAFIRRKLYRTQGIVQTLQLQRNCLSQPPDSGPLFPGATGLMIEGLSILASITRNSSIENMLRQAVSISTNQIGSWLRDDGVFTELAITSTSEDFAHSIGVVARRNVALPDLALYANDLLSVQYNAILEQATEGGNGIYGGLWTGPPSSKFQRWYQSSACYVLMAAIALPEKGSNAKDTGADSPASSGTDPTKQKFPVGGIVGAVIGAVLILALAVFLFRVWKRRRTVADETGTEKSDLSSDDMIPVPYINNSSIQRSSKMLNSQHPTTDETGPRIHSDERIVPRPKANTQRNVEQHGAEELDDVQEMSRSDTRHPRRHEDSGWRPDPRSDSESFDDLPPTYENAL